ncbi:unnamed protein product [Urochloa decumbens]|uniref:DUF4220 domain-containing protein n=1 Tax=Urochloa decumbens TaxID=240449 RepID=A0ABC9H8C1_9POAL
MAGANPTINCSDPALKHCSSKITCDPHMVSSFGKSMVDKLWRMNSLLLISAILAGVIVGTGIYGQRYRHHRFTRFIFLGATTLFLPVVSTVVSMGAGDSDRAMSKGELVESIIWLIADCQPKFHSFMVVIWASLVQIVMINTSAVVAVDDREGGSIGPPFELLVQGIWICYLGVNYIILASGGTFDGVDLVITALEVVPFVLTCSKMVLKYYAFEKARQSFALGRNPHLVSRYMKQQPLRERSGHGESMVADDAPPRLLVMGEEKRHVEKQPLGYVFKDDSWTTSHNNGLVTIDRVWSTFCIREQLASDTVHKEYGSWYFDLVPVILLSVLVMLAEVRDIASYICSNWTKVALTCHLVNNCASSRHSLLKKKWIGLLLRCRCKLMKHWDEKIGQCNILEIRPRTTLPVLLRRLLRLPDQKKKVKVQEAVKVCIMEVVRSRHGRQSNGTACLRRLGQVGERLLWACNNKSTSCTMLTWHIATSILETRYSLLHDQEQGSSSSPFPNTNYKVAATHLSRYCAYLVTWCPELLPDDKAWSSSQYEDVKKDVERVLACCSTAGNSLTPEAKCQQVIEVLSAEAKHEVLKEGARLGKQLLELMVEGEDTAWKLLAEFWSEMILYVAPSDNLKGHSEAIARGGELITLLWVLLFHAGIVSRPGEDDGVPATSAGVV